MNATRLNSPGAAVRDYRRIKMRQVLPALGNDPMGRCDPLGYPRNLWVASRAFEIVQTPSKMMQMFEWSRAYREIWTGKQRIPEDPDPRWYGWAAGRWEGDSFVIDSTGYNEKSWIDDPGYPRSKPSSCSCPTNSPSWAKSFVSRRRQSPLMKGSGTWQAPAPGSRSRNSILP